MTDQRPIKLLPKGTKGALGGEPICSFCRRPQSQVPAMLIKNAHSGVLPIICTGCLAEATRIAKDVDHGS